MSSSGLAPGLLCLKLPATFALGEGVHSLVPLELVQLTRHESPFWVEDESDDAGRRRRVEASAAVIWGIIRGCSKDWSRREGGKASQSMYTLKGSPAAVAAMPVVSG